MLNFNNLGISVNNEFYHMTWILKNLKGESSYVNIIVYIYCKYECYMPVNETHFVFRLKYLKTFQSCFKAVQCMCTGITSV